MTLFIRCCWHSHFATQSNECALRAQRHLVECQGYQQLQQAAHQSCKYRCCLGQLQLRFDASHSQVCWGSPYATHEPQIELSDLGVLKLDGHQLCGALMAIHPTTLERCASSCRRRLPEASVSNDVCAALRALQQDPRASLRAAAAAAVAELVASEQLDVRDQLVHDTIQLLCDPDAAVREQATLAAGHIGPQLGGPQLAAVLQVRAHQPVRQRVRASIGCVGAAPAAA